MKARVVQHYDKGPLPTFKNLSKEIDVLVGVNAFIGQLIFESAFIGNQRKNVESSALPGNDNGRGLTNEIPSAASALVHIKARLVFKCDVSIDAFRKSLYTREFIVKEVLDFSWILLSRGIARLLRTQTHFI